MTDLTSSAAWKKLQAHYESIRSVHMNDLFEQDPERCKTLSLKASELFLDYSKNRMTSETFALLTELANEQKLSDKIHHFFHGKAINTTENRCVGHPWLRAASNASYIKTDKLQRVQQIKEQICEFTTQIIEETWVGYTGKAITDIVSIGIGGSFLGPKIVTEALKPYWHGKLNGHFIANVDGSSIASKLSKLNPETTLFVVASKSFQTQETRTNATTAKAWFLQQGASEQDIAKHFVAVTSNIDAATAFGIEEKNIFPMWDWVGGRYSLWSAIGLPIALLISYQNFELLLEGAQQMDKHFYEAPFEENMPVLLGLIGIWYINFFQKDSHVILCYDHFLRGLPAYIQQLDMESNGKSVNLSQESIDYSTAPVIWGGEGTNGQHAFHQLLHQGTSFIPSDFILPLNAHHTFHEHHSMLASNCFGQTQALMKGRTYEQAMSELNNTTYTPEEKSDIATHKVMSGNKPSNTILMEQITPKSLGSLIALYEHKTFVQGAIWNINSFDQWGVELGKQLGENILTVIQSDKEDGQLDSSTKQMVQLFKNKAF